MLLLTSPVVVAFWFLLSSASSRKRHDDGSSAPVVADAFPLAAASFAQTSRQHHRCRHQSRHTFLWYSNNNKDENKVQDDIEARINQALEPLKKEIAELKQENAELKNDIKDINGRLNGIVRSFTPAIQHALLETAVYEFFNETQGSSSNVYFKSQLAHGIFSTVITGTRTVGKNITQDEMLIVLDALISFVRRVPTKVLINWPPNDRNIISHNGIFLNCLLNSTSVPVLGGGDIDADEVKFIRNGFSADKQIQISAQTADSQDKVDTLFSYMAKYHKGIHVSYTKAYVLSGIKNKTII